ncbi:pentatricopeptide repeat-containing protein At2g17210-like [Wolffia australiana]
MDSASLPRLLKACAAAACARPGAAAHARAVKGGHMARVSTANALVSFYSKCGLLDSSWRVFLSMPRRDSVTWNAAVHGFLSGGASDSGLALLAEAWAAGERPNLGNLVLALQACWKLGGGPLELYHGLTVKTGVSGHLPLQNSLLTGYAKSDRACSARRLFDEIPRPDAVSWTALIGGLAHGDDPAAAVDCFRTMARGSGPAPDGLTLVSLLQAYARLDDGPAGTVHAQALRRGLFDTFLGNSLVDSYAKRGDPDSARGVFAELPVKNLVSWNSLLSGLVRCERPAEALSLYRAMQRSGLAVDEVTLVGLLQNPGLGPAQYRSIHGLAVRRSLLHDNAPLVNTILEAYCRLGGLLQLAFRLFRGTRNKNLVSWSTMILGLLGCGQPAQSVSLFCEMVLAGWRPNSVVLLGLARAGSALSDPKLVRAAHCAAHRSGLAGQVALGTALLDAYAKCGEIGASEKVFRGMPAKSVVTWSAMIGAHGINGRAAAALALFREMDSGDVAPNAVTVLSLLSALSHAGMVEEGLTVFANVFGKGGVEPSAEHWSCVVDMLARAGLVGRAFWAAEALEEGGVVGPGAWSAVLSACRSSGDWEVGERALSGLVEVEEGAAGYVLAAQAYALGGLSDGSARMKTVLREKGLRVQPGLSWVCVEGALHRFAARDGSHPRSVEIREAVLGLHRSIRGDPDEIRDDR